MSKLYEILVPALPESVSDAVIISWYKQPGEYIEQDEPIVDIETDKVVLEIPAPVSGIMQEILEPDGCTVIASQKLGTILKSNKQAAPGSTEKLTQENSQHIVKNEEPPIISPAAKKIMLENNLTSEQVTGTGKDGRVLKEDVLNSLNVKSEQVSPEPKANPATIKSSVSLSNNIQSDKRNDRRVPMSRLRARIAQRLLDAQHSAAILTTFNEVNMQPVMELRKRYKDLFEKTHDVKLGFMSFFVKATVEALKQFPAVNASIEGNDIVYHDYFDVGVAVSSPRGLVVPILKNAQFLSMSDIEKMIKELAIKARDNKLSLDEINGGTFSITNGGVFGSLLSTPIINPPQSGILGMHKIQERPIVENGEIVIRPIMYLALSYDHRIIDGREAVQFLVTIKNFIEDPSRLLLEV